MSWNKAIGGYLGLEGFDRRVDENLFHGYGYINTGRNAFELLLSRLNIKSIQIPYYTCDALVETLQKNEVEFQFYSLNEDFFPVGINPNDWTVYVNYFGVNGRNVEKLQSISQKLLIDNSQALYSRIGDIRFYSPRKFLGVPDGGLVFHNHEDVDLSGLEKDQSYNRFNHLLKRVDLSAEEGYSSFMENEKLISSLPLRRMSGITEKLIQHADHSEIIQKRKTNFNFLNKNLGAFNDLQFKLHDDDVPLSYPFLRRGLRTDAVRKQLAERRVYLPTYWPEVLSNRELVSESNEHIWTRGILPIPIDQRYSKTDMTYLVRLLKDFL